VKPVHLLLLVIMNCLWAATLSAFKVLSPWLDGGGIVTWRFGLSSVACLLLWRWLPGAAPRGRDLWKAILIGVLVFCLGPRMQTTGVQLGKAGDAATLMAFEPLLCAVAAALVLRERIAARRWLGFGFCVLGVMLISRVGTASFQWHQLGANGLILGSFFAETAYSILSKPVLQRAGPFRVMAVALFAGTVLNLAWDGSRLVSQAAAFTPQAWWLLLYLSLVCTVWGYGFWLMVIREAPVNLVALTVFIQPLAGVGIALVWLHEDPHWGQLAGGLSILAGLVTGFGRRGDPSGLRTSRTGRS